MKYFLLTLLLSFSVVSVAQQDSLKRSRKYFDTILYSYENFVRDSLEIIRPPVVRPQFRFDNRNIFFGGQTLFVGGYDAGVLLADKLRVTVGYYSMKSDISTYKINIEGKQYERRLKLNYGTINTEFQYINRRFVSFGMPLEIGVGENSSRYKITPESMDFRTEKGIVVVTDFGLSGTFKPIRWIGIRAVVGYRETVVNQVQDFRFDGLFTSVGLNIDFREITKDFKMYRLMKRHHRISNKIETGVNLITD